MMRSLIFAIALGAGVLASGDTDASILSYTFTTSPGISHDLDGSSYYKWGINWNHTDEYITGAVLEIDNIYNWDYEEGVLYTHLLNNPPTGMTAYPDNWGVGDRFLQSGNGHGGGSAGHGHQSPWIGTWSASGDPGHKTTLVYDLGDLGLLSKLRTFAANGRFGFGFDPGSDLSFDQFTVRVSTSAVPEPTTMILLGLGLTGLGFNIRRRHS